MSIDIAALCGLSISEKLRIVEALWDDIYASDELIVLHTASDPKEMEGTERLSSKELQSLPVLASAVSHLVFCLR